MDMTQQGILTLLKCAVTGQAEPLPPNFSLEDALPTLQRHQIVPLAYDGAVCCGISPKIPVMRQMFRDYYRLVLHSEGQMADVDRVFAAFDRGGIDYMPLKGCNLKPLYPKPELRPMGDADVLIRVEQYERIRPILAELGFEEHDETDHELVWQSNSLELELHKQLGSSISRDFYSVLGNGWQAAKKLEGSRYGMSPEDEWMYLFTHFSGHYRSGGIGLRHVLDLWVYRRAFPAMDESYIQASMVKLHLAEFHRNICRLIRCWFDGETPDEKTAFITAFLFDCGIWGSARNHTIFTQLRKVNAAGSKRYTNFRSLLASIFPGQAVLQSRYPAVQGRPWLVPVFWVVRWFDALLNRRKNVNQQWQALQLAASDEGQRYRQALEYVGLDLYYDETK